MVSYLKLYKSGELKRRVEKAKSILENCTLCPRMCKVNRLKGEQGFCKSTYDVVISSYGPHHGEEPPLSGTRGSGTIFFTGCNLQCVFCQNYQISHLYEGRTVSINNLSKTMITLQGQGCHNINLVTPTHFMPQSLEAILIACENGLNIPIVYNTNGYDTIETLKLLDGIIDIYLPDIKYSDETSAKECSGVNNYVKYNRPVLKEMYRQVGNLVTDKHGIAKKGLMIRHLVLPNDLAGSCSSFDFIANELSKDTFTGIMAQYHPCYKAYSSARLNRRITQKEYTAAVKYAQALEMDASFIQPLISADDFLPDFNKEEPFTR